MRAKFAPVLLALLLAASGCGGDAEPGASGGDTNVDLPVGGDLNSAVPPCPFTAAKVSELVGQPMTDQGSCLFGDGKGVASVTISMASQLAGSATYDYQRKLAGDAYEKVADVQKGDRAYVAVREVQAEAVLIGKGGSYTMIMSSFGFDLAGYERVLRAMLDAIPQ